MNFAFGWGDGAPGLAALSDAHLEPWARFAPRPRLLAALEAARRVGMISNALTWRRAVAPFGQSPASDVVEPAPRLLREFLAAEGDAEDLPSALSI